MEFSRLIFFLCCVVAKRRSVSEGPYPSWQRSAHGPCEKCSCGRRASLAAVVQVLGGWGVGGWVKAKQDFCVPVGRNQGSEVMPCPPPIGSGWKGFQCWFSYFLWSLWKSQVAPDCFSLGVV